MSYKYIGKGFKRVDAVSKLTGKAKFIADIELPHMYYGVFIRSEKAHAEIVDVDISEAKK